MPHIAARAAGLWAGLALALAAPVAAAPPPSPAGNGADRGADNGPVVRYFLPATRVHAEGSLRLIECTGHGATFEADIRLVATPSRGTEIRIDERQLRGARFARTASVTTHPSGTLAALNASVTDELPAIIGHVITFAANVARTLAGAPAVGIRAVDSATVCSEAAATALARKANLEDQIHRIQMALAESDDPDGLVLALAELRAERAALLAGRLTAAFRQPVDNPLNPTSVALSDVLRPFFKDAPPTLSLHVKLLTTPSPTCPDVRQQTDGHLYLPQPVWLAHHATLEPHDNIRLQGTTAVGLQAPFAQCGQPVRLDRATGFGGDRSYSARFDRFGMMTEASWTSKASAARASEALAAASATVRDTAAALRREPEDEDLASIARLEKSIRLKRLEACAADLASPHCPR